MPTENTEAGEHIYRSHSRDDVNFAAEANFRTITYIPFRRPVIRPTFLKS